MRLAVTFHRVDPSKGGAETYVGDLCRSLVASGHDVTLFANSWRDDALPDGLHRVKVEAAGRTRWGRIWSFAKNSESALLAHAPDCTIGLINTWHQDVLIPQGGVHDASLEANSRRFAPGWRRWVYVAAKKIQPKWWLLYRAIEARQYDPRRGTRIVAVSRMVRDHLARFHRVDPSSVRVIPNAIHAARLAISNAPSARRAVRARHGLSETDVVGLFVGHNFRLKGLPALIRAMASRDPSAKPVHLLACGGGKIAPMQKLVDQAGLSATVKIVGFVPDVREYYHAVDFCVLPSYYDPCSLVVFEALACGLPVITTAQNGAGEVITQGREGFVVASPDDTPAMTQALDAMTHDVARKEMSSHAEALGRSQSFDRHTQALLELCREVADRKRNSRADLKHDTHRQKTDPALFAGDSDASHRSGRR